MKYPPPQVALFVHNRPTHTKHTLNALVNNIGAKASDLYVFLDAPKSDKDYKAVYEVLKVISGINGLIRFGKLKEHK